MAYPLTNNNDGGKDQPSSWDGMFMTNEQQFYQHLFQAHQDQEPKSSYPIMQNGMHHKDMAPVQSTAAAAAAMAVQQQQQSSSSTFMNDFTTYNFPPTPVVADNHTYDHLYTQNPYAYMVASDQLRCGGLSGVPEEKDTRVNANYLRPDNTQATFGYPPQPMAGTPAPTRSRFLFDDTDYQKLRQPPRSTPMIRKTFAPHSPMRAGNNSSSSSSSSSSNNSNGGSSSRRSAGARKSSTYTRWTVEEDELLRQAVAIHGPHKWSLIASHVPNRTPMQCSTRWLGALNPNIHKGRWTEHEDAVLKYSVMEFSNIPDGEGGFQPIPWNRIAERIPNRTGIQCQARWTEALDPTVRKGKWSEEEDALLRAGVEKFGRCWIRIAETVPGRTQRQCRTRWMQIKYKEEKMMNSSKKKRTITCSVMNDDVGSSASCTSTDDGQNSVDVPFSGLVADLPTTTTTIMSAAAAAPPPPAVATSSSKNPAAAQPSSSSGLQNPFVVDDFDIDLDTMVFDQLKPDEQDKHLDLLNANDPLLSSFFSSFS